MKRSVDVSGDASREIAPPSSLELSNGGVALVDAADLPLVSDTSWSWRRDGRSIYARANSKQWRVMHRVILGLTDPSILVDHVNGDGLDNRRSNLRVATNQQNQRNRRNYARGAGGLKGVTFVRRLGRWQAQIKVDGRSLYLGIHETERAAALAYDAAAREHFGEFAACNFPEVAA